MNLLLAWLSILLPVAAAADLKADHDRIRAEAVQLAGKPRDIPQRVVLLREIYEDSGKNHVFPLIALHGALWADGFFAVTGPIGDLLAFRFQQSERIAHQKRLRDFSASFAATNRQVFIDAYTDYYFTRLDGENAGVEQFVPSELLARLNQIHAARRAGVRLAPAELRDAFITTLDWEQERSVAPMVKTAVEKLHCRLLRSLALKPAVRFRYFPGFRQLYFRDFADKKERIAKAIRAYDWAMEAGLDKVEASMRDYGELPNAYFDHPSTYARALRARLLQP